ncbi:ATP/GTP-binding protein [Streptomyces mayteni]
MAGRDLRALFGSNDGAAREVFTNRETQWATVTGALSQHLRHVATPGFDVQDVEAPRTNLLVFHGVGGIGKTTLSRKLEAALADGERRPEAWVAPAWPGGRPRLVPVRMDLARSAGTDFERLVLTVRAALAGIGRPLPAFDLALRRYWDHNHPGEPLEEVLRRDGLARAGRAMPQQIQSALADVAGMLLLPGTVGSLVGQVTGTLVGALRERRQSVRALAGCRRLADLLEADPDIEALSYYPHLLAWELAQVPAGRQVVPVVLLDTFEDVGDRTHRDFERLVQRLVWLMPNCFFVITGRSRLQWADGALHGQLDWTGPTAWPGLADHPGTRASAVPPATGAGGRQVLVGDFSSEDREGYLARRLAAAGGQPLATGEVRRVIADRSHGLPLYLDLAVMRVLEIRRTGRTPEPADFDADFPALVARTLRDLTSEERHVLRSVSLLDSFDLPLATRAAGLEREAAARRLAERPFVRENPFGLWPYHLHALVRSTIRTAPDTSDDGWTPRDWHTAAQRALAGLGEQWRTGPDGDRALLVGCLRQGLALAADFHLELRWLADAAWTYVSDSVWEPIALAARPDATSSGLSTAADALVETLSALARRQHEPRTRTADRLAAVVDANLLPAGLREMPLYYLAKAHRDLGQSAASRHGMARVAADGGRLAPAARRGLAHLARLAGDFPTALETAANLGWAGRHHRVEGDVWWPHAAMDRAAVAYAAARDEAEQHGVAGERATSQAQRAFVLAFTNPATADDELELAEQLLAGLNLRATTVTTRIAALVRDAGTGGDVEDRARLLRAEVDVAGLASVQPTLELALAFHHAVTGNGEQVAAVIARLRELTAGGDYAYYVDIAHFMADLPLEAPSTARWIDDEPATRQRWRALVTGRRDQLAA